MYNNNIIILTMNTQPSYNYTTQTRRNLFGTMVFLILLLITPSFGMIQTLTGPTSFASATTTTGIKSSSSGSFTHESRHVSRLAAPVATAAVEASKTMSAIVVDSAIATATSATGGVCTRTAACADVGMQMFGNGISLAGGSAKAAEAAGVHRVISDSVASNVGAYVGPAIAVAATVPQVYTELADGNVAGATATIVVATSAYGAASAAAAACATASAATGVLAPFSPLFGAACGIVAHMTTTHVGEQVKEMVVNTELRTAVREVVNHIKAEENKMGRHMTQREYTRAIIRFIIEHFQRAENALMPSSLANLVLERFIAEERMINPSTLSNSEWYDLFSSWVMFAGQTDLQKTQQDRAFTIVERLTKSHTRKVSLFDGHGRMLTSILRELSRRNMNLDRYTFDVYEIDQHVQKWHELFLPKGMQKIHHTIFDGNLMDGGLVYFNYCGIGDLHEITFTTMRDLVRNGQDVFVSFSIRGMKKHTNFGKFYEQIQAMTRRAQDGISADNIAQHGKFVTFRFFEVPKPAPKPAPSQPSPNVGEKRSAPSEQASGEARPRYKIPKSKYPYWLFK